MLSPSNDAAAVEMDAAGSAMATGEEEPTSCEGFSWWKSCAPSPRPIISITCCTSS